MNKEWVMSKDKIDVKDILAYNEVLRLMDFMEKDYLILPKECRGKIRGAIIYIEGREKDLTKFEKLLDHGVYGNDDANLQDTIPYNLYNRICSLVNYPSPTSRANLKIEVKKSLTIYRKDLAFLKGVLKKLDNV